jgi:hypothetical protein
LKAIASSEEERLALLLHLHFGMAGSPLHEPGISIHHMAALLARAHVIRVVKLSEAGNKILLDIFKYKVGLVEFVIALLAEPKKSILHFPVGPLDLNHKSYCIGTTPRLMGYTCREQKHLALPDWNGYGFPVFLNAYLNISFNLKEEFFCFVVVIVLPGIRSAHNHHDVISGLRIQVFIAYRWLEQIAVFVDPGLEIEWSANHTSEGR